MEFNIKQHLLSRHIDFDVHTVYMSDTHATFMLYNLSGQIVGYQEYRPLNPKLSSNSAGGRYYTKRSQHLCVFGLETLSESQNTIFITEGIFDIARLTEKGCSGIALLTNAPNSSMYNFLDCLPKRRILISDNDKGGQFLRKSLTGLLHEIIIPPFKDLGEATENYVDQIINEYRN